MPDAWHAAVRGVVTRAIDEAATRHATNVEAEHLLLAVAADPELPASRVLADIDWDHDGIAAALEAERSASLGSAGIAPIAPDIMAATARQSRPGWGASARAAIKRAGLGPGRTGGRRTDTGDAAVVLGVLEAQVGTVPRMLTYANIDGEALRTRLRRKATA